MTFHKINPATASKQRLRIPRPNGKNAGGDFKAQLVAAAKPAKVETDATVTPPPAKGPGIPRQNAVQASQRMAATAYQQQAPVRAQMSEWEKYKEDQLLSNPGGDHYDLTRKVIRSTPKIQESLWERVGKDLSDGMANLANGFKNLFLGAQTHYRDTAGQIKTVTRSGMFRAISGFFKNIGSALTLGQWHPDQDEAPRGVVDRAKFVLSRLKHAVFGDLVQGVGGSAVQIGEDLVLAGWNLVEIVPDATIGNFETGRKLTTTIFDNGQVLVDYLTDILPTGEAWLRVHATDLKNMKAPVIYNINLKERYDGDERWRYVRNTPFRKTIETIGSILADIVTVKMFSNGQFTSENQKKNGG